LIGNGTSRNGFDLEQLRDKGTIYGCNALYRDFIPDVLFAIDSKMLKEFAENNLHKQKDLEIINRSQYRGKTFNTSGVFGLGYILEEIKPDQCYMLGMDFYAGNIYFKTKNYRPIVKDQWDKEKKYFFQTLKRLKGKTEIINVNTENVFPTLCTNRNINYRYINYQEFKDEIQIT
jgi:hypothetical protein